MNSRILTKDELHQLIRRVLIYVEASSVSASSPGVYKKAVKIISQLDKTIFVDISEQERISLLRASSAFNVHDFSLIDNSNSSQKLSEVNSEYEKTFGMNDPDVDDILHKMSAK